MNKIIKNKRKIGLEKKKWCARKTLSNKLKDINFIFKG